MSDRIDATAKVNGKEKDAGDGGKALRINSPAPDSGKDSQDAKGSRTDQSGGRALKINGPAKL